MKEYCVFVIYAGGCPYTVGSYKSFLSARQALMNMISDFDRRRKAYYIDNEFYDNKYLLGLPNSVYYQIQEREVTEWKKYEENQSEIKNNYCKCKIIKFHK